MLAMGSIAHEAAKAVELLTHQGVSCALEVVASINPAPVADLTEVLSHFRMALTVEAHYIVGGLGSLVAEVISEAGLGCRLARCGVRSTPSEVTGTQEYLLRVHELSAPQLADAAMRVLQHI
jgi:transketolase